MGKTSAPQLGARVRLLRERLGNISQTSLAVAVGAGRASTVSQWEHNRATPDRGTLKLLADLTDNADAVMEWLLRDGPVPPFTARADQPAARLGAPVAVSDRTVATLPPPPRVTNPEEMRAAFSDFVSRVAQLASSGKSVPAHYLLEWAALLLRTADAYQQLEHKLDIVRERMPRMMFELDANLRIMRYWAAAQLDGRPTALNDRQILDVLKQLDSGKLDHAVRAARAGQSPVVEFRDQDRHYRARFDALPDDHLLLCVDRANENRVKELGVT